MNNAYGVIVMCYIFFSKVMALSGLPAEMIEPLLLVLYVFRLIKLMILFYIFKNYYIILLLFILFSVTTDYLT